LLVHTYNGNQGGKTTDFRFLNSDKRIVSLTVYHSDPKGGAYGISGLKATLEDGAQSDMLGK